MPSDGNRAIELLAFCGGPQIVGSLERELHDHGMRVDVAHTLADLRSSFFARGGHDVFILTPDVPPTLAERAVHTLLDLDPHVRVIAFGRELQNAGLPEVVTRLPEHHPTSRAGIGAILRVASGLG